MLTPHPCSAPTAPSEKVEEGGDVEKVEEGGDVKEGEEAEAEEMRRSALVLNLHVCELVL